MNIFIDTSPKFQPGDFKPGDILIDSDIPSDFDRSVLTLLHDDGIYFYPSYNQRLGFWLSPSIADAAVAYARLHNLKIRRTKAAYDNIIGLSTQVPCRLVVLSSVDYTFRLKGDDRPNYCVQFITRTK